MGKKTRSVSRAAGWMMGRKINICQIPSGDKADVTIMVGHAIAFVQESHEIVEIRAKCCHCWKLEPSQLNKIINRRILEETVKNIQIRTKKLKNGGIMIY